jgi:hypothetical protein
MHAAGARHFRHAEGHEFESSREHDSTVSFVVLWGTQFRELVSGGRVGRTRCAKPRYPMRSR